MKQFDEKIMVSVVGQEHTEGSWKKQAFQTALTLRPYLQFV